MISEELTFRTGNRPATVDITGELAKFIQARGDGQLSVFVIVNTGEAAEFSTMTPHSINAIDTPAEFIMVFDRDGQLAHLHKLHES